MPSKLHVNIFPQQPAAYIPIPSLLPERTVQRGLAQDYSTIEFCNRRVSPVCRLILLFKPASQFNNNPITPLLHYSAPTTTSAFQTQRLSCLLSTKVTLLHISVYFVPTNDHVQMRSSSPAHLPSKNAPSSASANAAPSFP